MCMANACTLYQTEQLTKKFVATIAIPLGFEIIGNGEDPTYPYTTYLSLDKSAVSVIEETAILPATVQVPDLSNPGQTLEVPCETKMRQFRLRGPLFYNSVVSGFVATDPLNPTPVDPNDHVNIAAVTAFSSSKPVQIDDIIAYTCYECDLPDDVINGFEVTIEQGTEFIINNEGEQIPHTTLDPSNFFDELKGTATQVIYIPYTLALTPTVVI